jgi:hypothetical protein
MEGVAVQLAKITHSTAMYPATAAILLQLRAAQLTMAAALVGMPEKSVQQ